MKNLEYVLSILDKFFEGDAEDIELLDKLRDDIRIHINEKLSER